jgi:hypothetical protein
MSIRKNLSNFIGWKTKRKIVVIESDDWGSIRTKSKDAYSKMIEGGLELERSNFTKFDSLESNSDMELLFQVLKRHKDITGRHPVFTPMCVVANPDFNKIKETNYLEYFYEPFSETCKNYPEHDQVHQLWLQGINERLFVPQLHGREHLNPIRWLQGLKQGNEGLKLAFENESIGASYYKGQIIPEHLAAFDPFSSSEITVLHQVVRDAGKLFEEICGYQPKHFIASNSPEPRILEKTLKEIGVEYLTRYKIQRYPLGNGRFERQFNWLGKRNKFGQVYLTRNVGFEPSELNAYNTIENCINDIKLAFKWNKPAVISSHRVNYIGFIDKENRDRGLLMLDSLLKRIISSWPDVEFMTSEELGDLIVQSKNSLS